MPWRKRTTHQERRVNNLGRITRQIKKSKFKLIIHFIIVADAKSRMPTSLIDVEIAVAAAALATKPLLLGPSS